MEKSLSSVCSVGKKLPLLEFKTRYAVLTSCFPLQFCLKTFSEARARGTLKSARFDGHLEFNVFLSLNYIGPSLFSLQGESMRLFYPHCLQQ